MWLDVNMFGAPGGLPPTVTFFDKLYMWHGVWPWIDAIVGAQTYLPCRPFRPSSSGAQRR